MTGLCRITERPPWHSSSSLSRPFLWVARSLRLVVGDKKYSAVTRRPFSTN
jgi:hypothetical protein